MQYFNLLDLTLKVVPPVTLGNRTQVADCCELNTTSSMQTVYTTIKTECKCIQRQEGLADRPDNLDWGTDDTVSTVSEVISTVSQVISTVSEVCISEQCSFMCIILSDSELQNWGYFC